MSAYTIAEEHLRAALSAAAAAGIDEELLLRAMLGKITEAYRACKGPDDLRQILQFQLDNAQGDEDYMFMRP